MDDGDKDRLEVIVLLGRILMRMNHQDAGVHDGGRGADCHCNDDAC